MNATLGELFRRSRGAPIEFQGQLVRALFVHPLRGPEVVRVELRSHQARPEGICVKVVKGSLLIDRSTRGSGMLECW